MLRRERRDIRAFHAAVRDGEFIRRPRRFQRDIRRIRRSAQRQVARCRASVDFPAREAVIRLRRIRDRRVFSEDMLRRERRDVRAFHARVENLVAVCRPVGLKIEISGRALRNADVGLRGRAVAARPAREGVTRSCRLFQPERRRFQGVCRRVRLARLQRAAVQLIIDGIRLDLGLRRQRDSARHGHGIWVIRLSVAPLRKRIACANRRFNFQLVQQVHGKHAAVLGIVRCVVHLIAEAGNARVPVQLHVTGHCAGLRGQTQRRVCVRAADSRQFARLIVAQLPHGRVKARPREDLRALSINQAVVRQNILAVFVVGQAVGHGLSVRLHAAPRVVAAELSAAVFADDAMRIHLGRYALPQRHAVLNRSIIPSDSAARMFFRLNPACCVTALNRSFPIIIADNAARITNPAAAQRRNIARRITVFNGSPVIADNAASDAFSLHASADHGAVEHLTFVVFANNCGGLPFHRNLRIAKDQILNCSVKVAKQPRIAVRIRRTGQIADGVILSVEYARKRITDLRRVRFECADGRPVGVYRQIDIVHQQHRFAALAVARVHLVGELFELLGRGDVNRGSVADHPARQFAALFALDDLQNRQAVFGVRPRVVIRKNLGELRGKRAAVVDQVCAVFVVRCAAGHGVSVHLHVAPRVNIRYSNRISHSIAACACHGLPQRHASLYVLRHADDTSAIRSADISCRIAVPDTRHNTVVSDNSACIKIHCDNLTRRIAVLDRAFFHIADQTANVVASLYLSANHRAVLDALV